MLIIKRNPLGTTERINAMPNSRVIDYLNAYYTETDFDVDVYVGNELVEKDCDYGRVLREGDVLTMLYRPAEIGAIIAGALVLSLVLISLAPKPEIPNNVGDTSTSPNNSVSGQTNTVRKYEGIPNIYGRVISYPDLIANSIPQWSANRKVVRETFLIGVGEYAINQIRDAETDIHEIASSTATVYGPNIYPSDLLRAGFNSSVNNLELPAPDDDSLVYVGDVDYQDGDYGHQIITNANIVFSDSNSITIEQYRYYSYQDRYTYVSLLPEVGEVIIMADGSGTSVNIGGAQKNYTVTGVVDNGVDLTISVAETTTSETITGSPVYYEGVFLTFIRARLYVFQNTTIGFDLDLGSGVGITTGAWGEFTVGGFSYSSYWNRTYIHLAYNEPPNTAQDIQYTTIQRTTGAAPVNQVGPFIMSSTAEEIWFNVAARSGLQSSSGGQITVSVKFYAQEIDINGDDVGLPVSVTASLTGKTTSQVGQTVKLTGLGGKRYKVYAERTTNQYSGSAIQDIFWEEVFTINEYSGEKFGDVTIADVVTQSPTTQSQSSRKINVDVTRKLDGLETTNFADAVVDLITNKGGRPISEIDTDELYAISDSLSDDLKEFSFTFDDKNISLGAAVQTVCNVARVKVYREGQMWRFARDEAKPRTYLFNRRNLASGDNQTQSFAGRKPSDHDSVRLRYYNRSIESMDDVLINIDAENQQFIVGEAGANPKDLELAGCSNYAQALNRAHLEARKIVYQRWSVEDVALSDAANTSIGDRVGWADIYDGEIFEGEVRGNDGSTYYTSEPVTLDDGITYYGLVTDSDGNVMGPAEISAVEGNKKAFAATLPGGVLIADGFDAQAGSKYIIGKNEDIELYDFSVVERGSSGKDGRVSIKMIQYSNNIYEMDS